MDRQPDVVTQVASDIAGQKAGDDAAQEAGLQLAGQHAADESRRQSGPVGNGEGDEAGQHRDHQCECRATANLHQAGRQSPFLLERLDAEDEGESDRQTAGDDDRQHVGNAGQQVLVSPSRLLGRPRLCLGGRAHRRRATWRGQREGFLQHLLGFLQRPADRGFVYCLAGEAAGVDVRVGADDHHIGGGNLLGGERVLGAHRALRLDLDLVAMLGCGLLQGLCGHEGMRDAGRAGGDRHDPFRGGRCRLWPRLALGADPDRGQGRLDDSPRIADRHAGSRFMDRLAGKAGHFDVRVGSENDQFGGGQVGVHRGYPWHRQRPGFRRGCCGPVVAVAQ